MNKYIDSIKENNSSIKIEETYEDYNLSHLWNDESLSFSFSKSDNLEPLCNIILPEQLSAIFHKGSNKLEFIFSVIDKKDKLIDRNFIFNYKGIQHRCYFAPASTTLQMLSIAFRETQFDSKSDYRNLRLFRDYFTIDEQPEFIKDFFKNRAPYSFYVEAENIKINSDLINLLKTINYYMSYYDRNSPSIQFFMPDKESKTYTEPCYTDEQEFPSMINAMVVDNTLLETILVANKTEDPRLKFIFYYQMLEYCSYYFLDADIKKKLFHILKKPEVSYKAHDYSKLIIDELQEYFNKNKHDNNNLEKTISYYCTFDDIKTEIKRNEEYFCEDIEFEGGLKIKKLFKDSSAIDNVGDTALNQVRTNIEKIRNVLVHLRESRENKVILPTEANDELLAPYLFVLRRIAEKCSDAI